MITIREEMQQRLESQGMFDNQAKAVVDLAEQEIESMKGNWDKEAQGYPQIVIKVTWMGVKKTALAWIEANAPEAWFKPMFEQ